MQYLKTDETSARAFREEGMEPFTYAMEGKGTVAMSYFEVAAAAPREVGGTRRWDA